MSSAWQQSHNGEGSKWNRKRYVPVGKWPMRNWANLATMNLDDMSRVQCMSI